MIPAYITTFELLEWPRALAAECERLGLRPIMLDNASTYPPLVEWLADCPYEVHRVGHNGGCHVFFNAGLHNDQPGPYVLTDCDLDISAVPDDAAARMLAALELNPDFSSCGLSLETNDLPDHYELKADVVHHESRWWERPLAGGCFDAQIDTTFALYDPAREALRKKDGFKALRLDRPYTARHLPWYLDYSQPLPDDQACYLERCQGAIHWSHQHKKLIGESDDV